MRLLLDTCTFLWVIQDPDTLSTKARDHFVDSENEIFLSAVSAWEIAVKHASGRLPLPAEPSTFVPAMRTAHGIAPLDLEEEDSLLVATLPSLHRDPFDRMLVCQALRRGLTLVTPDRAIHSYEVPTLW